MPTKRKKRRACGPTNGGIEREFAKKSRLAGRHKTVKADLEASLKCARHCENRRFQARFAHFLRAFCAFLACIFDARFQVSSDAADASFRLPQGRFSASSGQALGRRRAIEKVVL